VPALFFDGREECSVNRIAVSHADTVA